jgi:hypothetical protein
MQVVMKGIMETKDQEKKLVDEVGEVVEWFKEARSLSELSNMLGEQLLANTQDEEELKKLREDLAVTKEAQTLFTAEQIFQKRKVLITDLRRTIKILALHEWLMGNKKSKVIAPGVGIRKTTVVNIYDYQEALQWAQENIPEIVESILNTTLFSEYVMKNDTVPESIARKVEEPRVIIASVPNILLGKE